MVGYCLCCVLLAITIIALLVRTAYKISKGIPRLLLPPSPPCGLPVIGHLHLLKKPLHRTLAAISAAHGPVLLLRFGSRPALLVSSHAAAEECFTKNDTIFANRPRLLAGKHLGFNYTVLGQSPYGPHWRNLRRLTTLEVFSSHCIAASSAVRRQEVRSLCRKLFELSSHSGGGQAVVNFKETFFELVLNVMLRLTMGRRPAGEEEAGRIREIVEETFTVAGVSNLGDFLPVVGWLDLLGMTKRVVRLGQKRDKLLQHLLDSRRRGDDGGADGGDAGPEGKKKSFLDTLLTLQQSDPESYGDNIIKGLIVVSSHYS